MAKENLGLSIDMALRMRRMCETSRSICRETIESHPDLNDELTVIITGLYNGVGNIQVKLDDCLALLNERMAILGDAGVEKLVNIVFKDKQPENPWEAEEDPDDDEPLSPYEADED